MEDAVASAERSTMVKAEAAPVKAGGASRSDGGVGNDGGGRTWCVLRCDVAAGISESHGRSHGSATTCNTSVVTLVQ